MLPTDMNALKRLALDYRDGEVVVRCLYRSQDGPNPGTKARQREVEELVRLGLRDALEALAGRVDVVGVSGYTVREDILCIDIEDMPDVLHKKLVKGA